MGRNSRPAYFPAWTETVGAMLDAQAGPGSSTVMVMCDTCKQSRDVDLAALVRAKGRAYSLINRRARCRLTPRCRGRNRFHYQSGVMRPLWDERTASTWIEADRHERDREDYARKRLSDLVAGRTVRFDPAPKGVDPTLWAICDDSERRRLMQKVRG